MEARNQLLGMAAQEPELIGGAPERPGRHAAVQARHRPGEGRRPRLSIGDINTTLSTAWGGSYVNDFIDRGRVKQVFCPGRCAVPHACPRTSTTGMCATAAATWCRSRPSRPGTGRSGSPQLERYNGVAVDGDPGRSRRPATAPARRWTEIEQLIAPAAARRRLRMDRPVLSGAAVRRPGAGALRDLAAGRVPVPGGALRELVDPVLGMLVVPLGVLGALLGAHAARARSTTSTSRSAC